MSGDEPLRHKRRANEMDGNDGPDVRNAPESSSGAAKGVIRIPRHIKEGEKNGQNKSGGPSMTGSSLFGDLAATSGGSSVKTFGSLLGAAQGASIFAAKPDAPESDGEDEEHSYKRLRRPTEFDFEAARRQREEEEAEAKQKELAESKKSEEVNKGEADSDAVAPAELAAAQQAENTPARGGAEESTTTGPIKDAVGGSVTSTTKSIFGPGLFGMGASTGQSLFAQAPVIKPIEPAAPTTGDNGFGLAEDISIDNKAARPTSFPGETDEEVVLEDFDTNLKMIVKNEAGQWEVKKIGGGVVRLLKDPGDKSVRCVFRLQGVWRLELNAPLSSFTMIDSGKPQVAKFMAYDMRKEAEPPEKQRSIFIISFPSADRKDAFAARINQ